MFHSAHAYTGMNDANTWYIRVHIYMTCSVRACASLCMRLDVSIDISTYMYAYVPARARVGVHKSRSKTGLIMHY